MAAKCSKHAFEVAVAQCRSCGEPFCDDCLVYTYGPKQPPFCVPCALVAAGVRRMSSAERKAMAKSKRRDVEIDPTAKSYRLLTVDVDRSPARTEAPAVDHVVDDVVDEELAAAGGGAKVPLAWVAIVVGLLLILVPLVTGNI